MPDPSPRGSARRPALAPSAGAVRDLRGGVRLALDGVRAGLDRLEAAHRRLADVDPPPRMLRAVPRGWERFVYRGLRGSADLLGGGLDLALASVQAAVQDYRQDRVPPPGSPARESLVAAVNALVGDHLHRTDNPLALPTRLRVRGEPLARVLVLVHDLGLAPLHWRQGRHDHGEALGAALGATPVYAHYNSGRAVASVARELAQELDTVLGSWRVPLQGVALLGHGLGGLVLRSAWLQASRAGLAWPAHVRHMVFLGTPHHGAQRDGLRLGSGALLPQGLVGPLSRLAHRRSDGLRDFLEGQVLERDPRTGDAAAHAVAGLPPSVHCHAVAGAVGDGRGDGVVPVASALGQHPVATRDLQLPAEHRWTVQGVDHLGLLASQAVFQKVRQWLSA